MAPFPSPVTLGRTGLSVGPLAVSGGYGADAPTLRKAFERGVNYWYHGSLRKPGMTQAIREIVQAGQREKLVLVLQSYSRSAMLLEYTFAKGLKQLGTEYADVLLLGWHNGTPSARILDRATKLKERGLVRHLAISGHHRPSFVEFAKDPRLGILHIRYNAAHPGAEKDVFPAMPKENRPGIVAYTATSWGKLFDPGKMPRGEAVPRGRDAYRFVLSNPDFNVCMTGPKDAAQMDEALAALDDGPLSAEEMARMRKIGAQVHG
ncbi:MAG TPA: aldo/keto reductase [Myxococcales bacterium]|jgi:aryl-alcohol dehydrogenase-like predicted oxidoreductase